ncbi:nitrite reductase, copper-containing [Candidatus Uhrbacteria bacterium]|jgi:nitrite reductase (NO-forming)|nr:nitrite reductase, copper-containing [Candidatus Uhrbacteria bacterium]
MIQMILEIMILVVAVVLLCALLVRHLPWKKLKKRWKKFPSSSRVILAVALALLIFHGGISRPLPVHFALPPHMQTFAPKGVTAAIPFLKVVEFFIKSGQFERVEDIGADPNEVPPPITRGKPTTVELSVTAKEVIGEVADGISFNFWTYDGAVPGPFMRVREGDTVELTITNDPTSLHAHNIDLHAVNGPGGGAALSSVEPGETKTFSFKAMAPGLYVYHCATANVSTHNSHGQYGLILVEPEEGMTPVDKEFYVMQGELYTSGGLGKTGLVTFDSEALLDGNPTYVTFNGVVEDAPRMQAEVGDTIRMYVGNGGTNQISSFHVIGEIFDTVYPEAALSSAPLHDVQTTAVLPGGAAIVEFTVDVPGNYILVDHALARMNKGAWAILEVTGEDDPSIYSAVE